jgi:ketosteroid isomerase-like protein
MSQADIETLRAGYEALSRGDWDAMFRDVLSGFELTTPPEGVTSGTYRGREEVQGYVQELLTPFEAWTFEPEEFFDKGDQVVVFVKVRARPKDSSTEIGITNGHLWTMRDGKSARLEIFPKPEEALEAAGLSEQDPHADS